MAQTSSFSVHHYTVENIGLSHNTVQNVMQDSRGFIWVSTMDGLNRFDGKQMRIFRHVEGDSTSLSDSFVHGVFEANDGTLWISTRNGGLNVFDPITEQFSRLGPGPGNPDPGFQASLSLIFQDTEGAYWLSFFEGDLGIFNPVTNEFMPVALIDDVSLLPLKNPNSILQLADGSFLCASFKGLYHISAEELNAFRAHPEPGKPLQATWFRGGKREAMANAYNLFIDDTGVLWVDESTDGFYAVPEVYLPETVKKAIKTGPLKSSAEGLVVEREQYLLVAGTSGVLQQISKDTGARTSHTLIPNSSADGSAKLYESPSGELWMSTWGNGFLKIEEQKGIEIYTTEQVSGLGNNFMLSFEETGSALWVGTFDGLYQISDFPDQSEAIKVRATEKTSIWSIEQFHNNLWFGTNNQGLGLVQTDEPQKVSYFTPGNSFIASLNVHQVFADSRGWLWIGYEGEGLQVVYNSLEWIKGEVAQIQTVTTRSEPLRLNSDAIRRIYEDKQGDIWLATMTNGFTRIRMNDKKIVGVQHFPYREDGEGMSFPDARSILQLSDSTYWFATYGGGLTSWNASSETFTWFTTSSGLPNNSTYGILPEQNKPAFWVSTNLGVARINADKTSVRTFTEADGLQNNEFNTGAYLALSDGSLLFGGIKGFNRIIPEQLNLPDQGPEVVLTTVNLFNEPFLGDTSAVINRSLELEYDQNFLSFQFAALDYHAPKRNEYAYKMTGIDEDWVYSGNRNFADYPNLAPGTYTFNVKAANSFGVWNQEARTLFINISPPWWNTRWFRVLVLLMLIGTLVATVRYFAQRKLRQQLRSAELENKLRGERERISRDLHDHVGAQLANIRSGLELADRYTKKQDTGKSSELMQSLRYDAQDTIKQLRETIWALSQKELTLSGFEQHVKEYMNKQTSIKEALEVRVSVTSEQDITLSPTMGLNLFRIIQEASQNTLKYAGAKHLDISVAENNGTLSLSIRDDGTFKPPANTHNGGLGLGNMNKRARELNGALEISTDKGTQIDVNVPLKILH
ncbi:MAG: two-component regulator propeller domain-containing protein [Bacteroidota bacterium]